MRPTAEGLRLPVWTYHRPYNGGHKGCKAAQIWVMTIDQSALDLGPELAFKFKGSSQVHPSLKILGHHKFWDTKIWLWSHQVDGPLCTHVGSIIWWRMNARSSQIWIKAPAALRAHRYLNSSAGSCNKPLLLDNIVPPQYHRWHHATTCCCTAVPETDCLSRFCLRRRSGNYAGSNMARSAFSNPRLKCSSTGAMMKRTDCNRSRMRSWMALCGNLRRPL